MKLALIFFACFVAVTLQLNINWRSQAGAGGLPNYFGINKIGHPYPDFRHRQEAQHFPYYWPIQADEVKALYTNPEDDYPEARAGFQIVFNTKTVYSTSLSTMTIPTLTTCYTSTMFASTTACRRKKSILDTISVEEVYNESPTPHEIENSVNVQLPREGRDMDTVSWIESSIQQDSVGDSDSHLTISDKQLLHKERGFFRKPSTATVMTVSYTFVYSTSTSTNTKLAQAGALSCLPSGFPLC